MKAWKTKRSGKRQYILLFTVLTLVIYMLFTLYTTNRYGGTFLQNLLEGIFILIIVFIAWFATFIPMIKRLKIPYEIVVDPEQDLLKLVYTKNHFSERKLSSIGYNLQDQGLYCVLRLLEKRAYSYRKDLAIFGLLFGNGWKKKQLIEIAEYLNQNNIQFVSKESYKA